MTRCYEFYCMVLKSQDFCNGKGDRIVDYINEYITFMNTKGINFDRSQTDKARFQAIQQRYGSEGVVAQKKLPHNYAGIYPEINGEIKKTNENQPSLGKKSVESCSIRIPEQATDFFLKSHSEEPIQSFRCQSCGKSFRVDWSKGELKWDS